MLAGKTRSGKPNYYMAKSKRAKGVPVEEIPEGFEIHEDPATSKVFVRRIVKPTTTKSEQHFVEKEIRQKTNLKFFLVEQEGDALVIYVSSYEGELDSSSRLNEVFGPKALEYMASRATYSKHLQFILRDETQRLFSVERWCWRGSIENWIGLAGPAPLAQHAERYLPHLGMESFFEMM